MSDFIHKNTNRRKSISIDGVSPGKSRPTGSIYFGDGHKKKNIPQAQSPRGIDDFTRREGLSPAQSTRVMQSAPSRTTKEPTQIIAHRSKLMPWKKIKKTPKLDGVDRYAKKAQRRKRLKMATSAFLILLLVGFAGYGYLRKIFGGGGGAAALEQNVDPSKLRGEGDGRVNILLMGRGGIGHDGADLTDTMIVVSIDPINKEAGIVSIPRDLYVTVPDAGAMKINSVFYTGKTQYLNNATDSSGDTQRKAEEKGFELAQNTVQEVLGIPIHYHGMVDFKGFKKAIDTVGGVDINVPTSVYENMLIDGQPYTLNVKKGQKHMEGYEALAYARSRHTSTNGDFDRSERQRLMIVALKDKILSAGTFSNPAKMAQLVDNFGDHVETDFSITDMSRLYELSKEIDSSKISSLNLVTPPNDFLTTSNIGGLSVVLPRAGADDYKEIHNYIRNTLKDGYIKNENANIMVLNGTQREGVATEKADELKSYGYNIGTVDNAPTKNYANTIIVDLRGGQKKYTKRYLEQRFGITAVDGLPDKTIQPGNADFVIILGNDTRTN